MSEWKKTLVGQVCKMNQSSYTSKDHWDYVNYLDTGSITKNFIEGYDYIDLSKTALPSRAKRKIEVGDIVYSTVRPNLCHYGMLESVPDNCLVSTGFAVIKASEDKINPRFLYYFLTLPKVVEGLHSIGEQGQATYPAINPSDIEELEIAYPDRSVQDAIVSILSNYDSAIANCRRQISLLEEAAMRLYKEWFKDGKGEKKTLGDLIEQRHKPVSKKGRDNYPCYVPIDQLPQHSLVCLNKKPVQEAESSLISFSKGDVIFGAMRPYFHKVVIATSNGLTRSTCFVLNSKQKEYYAWMICTLFSEETIRFATSISVGATMPYVRWDDLSKMRIVVPSIEAAYKFNQFLVPYWHELTLLANQIQSLTEARDRLLPKLMKGEIAV